MRGSNLELQPWQRRFVRGAFAPGVDTAALSGGESVKGGVKTYQRGVEVQGKLYRLTPFSKNGHSVKVRWGR